MQETWFNGVGGGHNNQLAMLVDSKDDGRRKCHNWNMQRLSAQDVPEDLTMHCYKMWQRLDAPDSPSEVDAARASGSA